MCALACLAALAVLAASSALADDFGARQPGQQVYDRAAVLAADDLASLESRAAELDQAGVPTIVYLRRKNADDPTTRQDARNLMDAWHVESTARSKDGLVVLLNLRPADPRHGSVGLVAGSAHATDGRLTNDRLQAIFDGQMRPRVAEGDIAGAVAAALAAVKAALQAPGPGSADDVTRALAEALSAAGAALQALGRRPAVAAPLAGFVRGPLEALATVLAAAAGGGLLIVWRRNHPPPAPPTLVIADEETPAAVAGALAAGRLPQEALEATVLDLARKGAIRIEATGDVLQPYQLRLLDANRAGTAFEQVVMSGFAARANGQGVVAGSASLVVGMGFPFKAALRATLFETGLFAPNRARLPTSAVAVLAFAAGAIVLILCIAALEPRGLAGAALLLGVGLLGLMVGRSLRDTTPLGEQAAVAWRRLGAGLRSAAPGTIRPEEIGRLLPLAAVLDLPAVDALVSEAAAAGCWSEWFEPVR